MNEEKVPFTKEQLKSFSKDLLIEMVLSMASQMTEMNKQMALLTERINVMLGDQYGRRTEKSSEIPHQMEFCFNEAEVLITDATEKQLAEPTLEEIVSDPDKTSSPEKRKSHAKGSREEMLKDIPHEERECSLNGKDLECDCGGTYKEYGNGDDTTRLEFTPASFKVVIYHIKNYRCSKCGDIKRAPGPAALFEGSLATPSLLAGIMTAKYINAMPFYRLETAFANNGALIRRQTMARWMIMAAERYFSLLFERMKEELLSEEIIHADETTVMVSKDERKAGSKSYMWVYTTEKSTHPVVIFEYQKTRAASHPKEFLAGYQGYLCCDGYEAYHTLGRNITICGCWVHARRHYSNAVKALQDNTERTDELNVSREALRRIGELFDMDKAYRSLSTDERLEKRQKELRVKADEYFEWVRSKVGTVPPKSETGKGLTYCMNQKNYLLACLSTADVPLDNSEAERKIRNFVISRKNFVLIDTVNGANASAILFSLAETAKANNLRPYEYFKYLLEEIPVHMDDTIDKFNDHLEKLLPWSEDLPTGIRKQ